MKTKLWLFLLCLALTYVACRKENNFSISETETSQQQDWSSSSRNAAYGHPFLDYRWPADWTDVGYDWLGQKPQTLDVVKQSMQAFEQDHPGVLNLIDEGIGRPVWEALTEVVFDESDGIELDVTSLPLIDPDEPLLTGLIFSIQSPGQDMRFLIAKTDDIDAFQDTTQLEEDLRGLLPAMGLFAQSYREWFFPEQRRAQSRGDCLWPWDGVKCPSAAGGKSRFKKWFAGLVGSGGNGPSGGKSQTTVITSSSSWVFLLAGGNSNIPDGERNTGGGSKYDEFCHKPKEELNFEDITRLMETMTEMITRGELSEMPQNVFHVARADCFEEGVDFGACLRASYVCEIRDKIELGDELLDCLEDDLDLLTIVSRAPKAFEELLDILGIEECEDVRELLTPGEDSPCDMIFPNTIKLSDENSDDIVGQILLGLRAARRSNCINPCSSVNMEEVLSDFPFGLKGGKIFESTKTIGGVAIPIKIDLTSNTPIEYSYEDGATVMIGQERWYRLLFFREGTTIPAMSITIPLEHYSAFVNSNIFD
ncbi:MAG: hypothetical protein AAFV25_25625, partial [Bacteroidota bacterium]